MKNARKAVCCPNCNRLMFYISITMDSPPVGSIGEMTDFTCPNRRCGYKSNILIGVADLDERDSARKVEDELRKTSGDSDNESKRE